MLMMAMEAMEVSRFSLCILLAVREGYQYLLVMAMGRAIFANQFAQSLTKRWMSLGDAVPI
jgi:hypothetical protein